MYSREFCAKFLRTPFFTEHLRWLLLKKETSAETFYCEFSKSLTKTFFIEQLRVTASLVSKIILTDKFKHFKLKQ